MYIISLEHVTVDANLSEELQKRYGMLAIKLHLSIQTGPARKVSWVMHLPT